MKIKLLILDSDVGYLNRITSILNQKYRERFAVFAFTDPEAALPALKKEKIDVFLADDSFLSLETQLIPQKCGVAYFVDTQDITAVNGRPAICKFQKAELIYKQILAVYSETLSNASVRNIYSDATKTLLFSSPGGGVGTSSAAAACAMHFAAEGLRCLYLNLEKLGGAAPFFTGEGSFDMSDVIYAIKSGKGSLPLKLESCARRDRCGVYFFEPAKLALDMMEFTAGEQANLISALAGSGMYDYVVVDADFGIDPDSLTVYRQAHMLVWVTDGAPSSVFKVKRARDALSMLEGNAPERLLDRVCLIYNKAAREAAVPGTGLPCVGTLPKVRRQSEELVAEQLADADLFDEMIAK